MVVGDVVRFKKINNNQKMVVNAVSKDAARCRWFNLGNKLHDAHFSKANLIIDDDYELWNKIQTREIKLKRILK